MNSDLGSSQAFEYDLPPELIARAPAERRDAARLLVLTANGSIQHRTFSELPMLLNAGDLLVLNETAVIRARLRGRRIPGGGIAELLLLHPADDLRFDRNATRWLALVRPGQKLHPGRKIAIGEDATATIEAHADGGARIVRFESPICVGELLERYGEVPLPPYIGDEGRPHADRYQTIFARVPGSVAAPTASLHFSDDVFANLSARGVEIARIALDVGLGTFRPILEDRVEQHPMHAEPYVISSQAAEAIALARKQQRRVIAAGTTVMRALEASAQESGEVVAGAAATDLYIKPGFSFRVVDAMVTNFHLPRSTLL
ncbi:MAG TPA: tRNA preQ1(34) S-adenosylmethionine ribosyltransferase-isomerase QueA, partial [Candidatus Baltobacteraceae bacterium]|nr:tRNA preQ1(34) S-adenosylmethionine ribosyltransferase-isomerase QueA [Candidatus Baltobacteraceae bacterium]